MAHFMISYSRQDLEFARHLKRLLEAEGFTVWIDETRLQPGEQWWKRIQDNIDRCAAVLVVMSPRSEDSSWVEREILYADRRRKPIFPVLLEGDVLPLLAHLQHADMRAGTRARLPGELLANLKKAAAVPPDTGQQTADRGPSRRSRGVWAMGAVLALILGGGVFMLLNRLAESGDHKATPTPIAETATGTSVVVSPSPTRSPSQTPTVVTPSPSSSPAVSPSPFPTASTNRDWAPFVREINGVPMVYVPAGCFTMGSDQGEPDELPEHEVCLSAYWIGQTEVTNAQYRPCVEAKACSLPADPMYYDDPAYADYPVVYVRWTDASTFARWFGGSLPTEAQWEYAARGPDGWAYPWGSEFYGVWLNYCDSQCARQYHDTAYDDGFAGLAPVGSYAYGASWVGALDMAGNVWEWTNDWYDESYYATVENGVLDPPGPAPAEGHVIRGGGWNDDRTEQRASFRGWREPFRYDDDRGFRVVVAASAVP